MLVKSSRWLGLFAALLVVGTLVIGAAGAQDGKQVRARPAAPTGEGAMRRWALIVGVGAYDDPSIAAIPFCVQDARDLGAALDAAAYEVCLLHDLQEQRHLKPTKNNVLVQAERFLSDERIGPNDLVLVYFSCHGFATDDGAYLAASDTWQSKAELTGLKVSWLRDLLKACAAGKKLLVLDACHSGLGKALDRGVAADHINAAAQGAGMATLASCKGTQKSWELRGVPGQPDGRNSAFTYFLIEALRGAADRDRDGEVVLSEVNRYVYDRVTAWARQKGLEQTPVMNPATVEGEIALARCKAPSVRVEAGPAAGALLAVSTDPPGAIVTVGGREVGTTPCEVGLPAGRELVSHSVEVRKEGYRPIRLAVDVSAGDRVQTGVLPLVQSPVVRQEALPDETGNEELTRTFYVAPDGSDRWSGTRRAPNASRSDGPFATLARARDAVRALKGAGGLPKGGVVVELREGLYELGETFQLTAEDSGTEASPIVYRARQGERVRLVGGRVVTGFGPVSDPGVLARMDPAARGKVLQADLRAQGILDYGQPGGGGLELIFQDRPMTLARWPNDGFTRIQDVTGNSPIEFHGMKGDKTGRFTYEGDRPRRWVGERDVWVHGYWFWDWAEQRHRVESIDLASSRITVTPPYHIYGYRKGQWYYAFNLLPELDTPGEWFLDRQSGILYFWPPAPIGTSQPIVSVIRTLIGMKDTSHVSFEGLCLEAAQGDAVRIEGGSDDRIAGCTIRNVGGWGVAVSGGLVHSVAGCEIYQLGDGGISLAGGDRATLTPARHVAENNDIHNYARLNRMYRPGISLSGVGNRAAHNHLYNAPHMAIGFGGNDHLIEFNEVNNVCYESNDAGAIYSGREWSMRGTVIRHNYLHHISGFEGKGCVGVYLDDQFSGTRIFGNVFYQVTRAAMIGGGRDNTIENNIFVDCAPAVHVDARGLGWASASFEYLKARLEAVPYKSDLWAKRYPGIAATLEDEPMAPKGNLIARNICVGGKWDAFESKAKPLVTFVDNLLDADPHFVDQARGDFRLRSDSPALRLRFQPIPLERIGLYPDENRPSHPVAYQARQSTSR